MHDSIFRNIVNSFKKKRMFEASWGNFEFFAESNNKVWLQINYEILIWEIKVSACPHLYLGISVTVHAHGPFYMLYDKLFNQHILGGLNIFH